MGEREKNESFHKLLNAADLIREELLSASPEAETLPKIFWDKIKEMHGQGVRLMLEKKLCATDMNPRKGWLSIPKGKIHQKFLTEKEILDLDLKDMTVSLIELGPGKVVRHKLKLRKDYKRKDYFSYVLTKGWNAITHSDAGNGLEVGCLIQLWAFRVNGDLYFCLVNCGLPPATVENMATRE
ncbi:hypothetical protein BT93_L1483 [Corymbia citriodora subsp. variegata]|uniref:TF-B3 domain-containing protein n=1 Tax=Corymbia citriodora subsp. variegata TaxID=360336 RepID=A0A8T0CQ10_CORYI|nr:hypothetical protein BT93_L1483 [Corymbia citriodora subsp. variegata]